MIELLHREVASLAQVKALKEELAKKASMLIKVKEEKGSGSQGKVRFSPAVAEAKEKEELRKTIRRLEERLRDGDSEDAKLPIILSLETGDRFGDHLCVHCANLPCVSGCYQFTNTKFTRPITEISKSIYHPTSNIFKY